MPGLNVVSFYGPMLVGVFVSVFLYGIWNYFQKYKRDKTALKLFVFYLLLVETVETILAVGVVFQPLILENGKPEGTTMLPYLLPSQPILATLISTPVQLFTAWRIYIITQSFWMPLVISFFSLASFGSSFYSVETTAKARLIAHKSKLTHPYFLITAAVTDILITTTLIYSLSRRKSQDRPMNLVLRRIMRLALQTGTITSIFTLVDAISIYLSPKTAISFAFDFPVPKLYSNALLSTLNARSKLSKMANMKTEDAATSRIPATETGFVDEEEDREDYNPLFGSVELYGKSGASSSGPRRASGFTRTSGSGRPITFAPMVNTHFTSTGAGEIDETEECESPVRSGHKVGEMSTLSRLRDDVSEHGKSIKPGDLDITGST